RRVIGHAIAEMNLPVLTETPGRFPGLGIKRDQTGILGGHENTFEVCGTGWPARDAATDEAVAIVQIQRNLRVELPFLSARDRIEGDNPIVSAAQIHRGAEHDRRGFKTRLLRRVLSIRYVVAAVNPRDLQLAHVALIDLRK